MNPSADHGFKTYISAEASRPLSHLKETFESRDLIRVLVKRDFSSRYKQTLLGPLWAVIQPLLTTLVFIFVFGSLAGLTTADTEEAFALPAFLFYLAGSICWSYFAGSLSAASDSFLRNRSLMGKVYFPRLAAPVSTSVSQLIPFGIQFALLAVLTLCFALFGETDIRLTPALLLLPVLVLQLLLLATGCGIIVSALTTKYRDLHMLVSFGLQLWHYATPVAYGLSLVTSRKAGHPLLVTLYLLNPMTPIVTAFRYALFGSGYFSLGCWLISLGLTLVLFFIGLLLFNRVERSITDTI